MTTLTHELETVRDWLRYAVSRFVEARLCFGHGLANAYDEAAYIVLHTLHLPLDRLEPFLDAHLTHGERGELLQVIERRVNDASPAGLPYARGVARRVSLLCGRARHHSALVHRRAGCPTAWRRGYPIPKAFESALDVCTGSGCLAVLLAHHFPNADVDASDISSDALAVAQRNVAEHGLQDRINLIRSDLLSNLTEKTLSAHHQQSALRQTPWRWRSCRPSTRTSRRSHWREVTMDSTPCGPSSPARHSS